MMDLLTIRRPPFGSVALAEGRRWRGGAGWRYEEKLDGRWCVRECDRALLVGEAMRDGRFFAFDVVRYAGQDLRPLALRERLQVLDDLTQGELRGAFLRPATGQGGEFLEAVLAAGGEGIVAKPLSAPWGASLWFKCKRVETFDCVVTEKNLARGSIRLALNGEDCGWCPALRAFESLRVGDVVEIAAYRRNVSGKFREPQFIRARPDKSE